MSLRTASCILSAFPVLAAAAAAGDFLAPMKLASTTPGGVSGNDASHEPAVSHDGRYVTFWSRASNLLPGDTNMTWDVFLRDNVTGVIEIISVDTNGGPSDGPSTSPSISADARYVCFNSAAKDLVAPNTTGLWQIFVRDRLAGTTEVVSKSTMGAVANNTTEFAKISADGRFVVFASYADNLVPGDAFNGWRDIFIRDRVAGTTIRVSTGPGGVTADQTCYGSAISGDGRWVAFRSQATNLVPGGTTQGRLHVYLYDSLMGTLSLASADAGGNEGNADSRDPGLSAGGDYLAFGTSASNLLPPPGFPGFELYLRNLATGVIERANLDSLGNPISFWTSTPSLSADGRFVGLPSGSVVLPGQFGQLYVRDRMLGKTVAVCTKDDGSNPPSLPAGFGLVVSGDGTTVGMEVSAPMVAPDTNFGNDVYLRGLGAPATYCTAKTNSQGCVPKIGFSGEARVSNSFALTLTASNALNNMIGLLIHGLTGPQAVPFAAGFVCVAPPFARSFPTNSGGNPPPASDFSGVYSLNLGTVLAASPIGPSVTAGSVLCMQWWGRDTGFLPANAVQLTDALQVVVGP